MSDQEIIEREPIKPLKLYWIYDQDGWFMGGNPCPVGKEYFAKNHMKWLKKKHPELKLHIEWEEGTFTYQESYIRAREKCEAVQRDQPGIRDTWNNADLSWEISKLAHFTEVARVRIARVKDAKERDLLGTDDQKVLDAHRAQEKKITGGERWTCAYCGHYLGIYDRTRDQTLCLGCRQYS